MADQLIGPKGIFVGRYANDAAATAGVVTLGLDLAGAPRDGMWYFDTTLNVFKGWDSGGAAWVQMGGGASSAQSRGEMYITTINSSFSIAVATPKVFDVAMTLNPLSSGFSVTNTPAARRSLNNVSGGTINVLVTASFTLDASVGSATPFYAYLYKNGVNIGNNWRQGARFDGTGSNEPENIVLSSIISMANNDYVEVWGIYQAAGNITVQSFTLSAVEIL